MSELVGAQQIADKLSAIAGKKVSRWQVYRLAKRKHTPIKRDSGSWMLRASSSDLRSWWRDSRFAPIFAKQLDKARNSNQPRNENDTLRILGVIGVDDLTDSALMSAIDQLGQPQSIRVLINSEGGLVSHGLAIYHALRTHKAKVEVEIVGVAASMASAIAMAGDKVSMAEDALFMIHDPWTAAAGNAEDLRAAAEMLDKHGGSLAAIYSRKTGIKEDKILEMMGKDGGEGTWMNSKEALDAGFIDEVLSPANARLPKLPAAALAKRLSKGVLPMKYKNLVTLIHAAIIGLATSDTTEDQVVEQVAEATDIDEGDITQLLAGEGEAPGIDELQAYAEVLDIDIDAIVAAAKKDGIKVEKPSPKNSPKKPLRKRTAAPSPNPEITAAVQQALAAQARVRARVKERGAKLGIPDSVVADIAIASTDLEDANDQLLAWLSDPKNQKQITGANGHITVGDEDRDKWMDGMSQWLIIKSGNARLIEAHAKKAEGKTARLDPGQYRGFKLLDIARDVLEREGVNVRGMSPQEIAKRAVSPRAEQGGLGTRSDFPIMLENVLHKLLLAAYETTPDKWRMIAATGSVQDFRAHPRLRLGSLPRLSKLLESGEFSQMHFPDAKKESIKADTFGNIIGLNRQAIVNDDVDGFSRLTTMLGRASARSIEIDVFALFGLNSGLGPTLVDGNSLFHAAHSNIDSGTALPTTASIDTGRVLMAQQKDPDDNDFLDLVPDVWVGPIGHGSAARLAITAEFDFDAETSGSTGKFMKPNTVRGLLSTVVDTPRLTGDRWYLLADPDIAPVFEVVFLEGQESPVIEIEEGFDYDGVRWRVRHDYGVGATDHRGATTNAGS